MVRLHNFPLGPAPQKAASYDPHKLFCAFCLSKAAPNRSCGDVPFAHRRTRMNCFFRRVLQIGLAFFVGALTAGTSFGQSSESISVGPGTLSYKVTENQTTCVPNPGQRGTVYKSVY